MAPFLLNHWQELSSQLHAPTAILPITDPLVSIGWEDCGREITTLARNRIPIVWSSSPSTTGKPQLLIQYRDSRTAPGRTLYFEPPSTCVAEGVSFFSLAYQNDKKEEYAACGTQTTRCVGLV
jgi:hypothetical protein